MADTGEYDDEVLGFMKYWGFLDYLRACQFPWKDSAPRSNLVTFVVSHLALAIVAAIM